MKIADIQRDLERSIANLQTSPLPSSLQGLMHLRAADCEPRVIVRDRGRRRTAGENARDDEFDPNRCEVVIRFVPSAAPRDSAANAAKRAGGFNPDAAMDALLEALGKAELARPFVGLKWFRDRFLPSCGYRWAEDPGTGGSLLRRATDEGLIVTGQVANPNQPSRPVTTIRINRKHRRFEAEPPEGGSSGDALATTRSPTRSSATGTEPPASARFRPDPSGGN